MTQTVVVYHSGYGHTQRVAQHVAQGASATLVAMIKRYAAKNDIHLSGIQCNI